MHYYIPTRQIIKGYESLTFRVQTLHSSEVGGFFLGEYIMTLASSLRVNCLSSGPSPRN